jgi:enolase-phosphatase E1
MLVFSGRGILLDIEGTTSSIRFVYDVLFPYAREHLTDFLARRWEDPAVQRACERIAQEAGAALVEGGSSGHPSAGPEWIRTEVLQLMDKDVKATGLKELQGLIWEEGYRAGKLRSHVYPDVPPALRQWTSRQIDIRIFSSGSVTAQKLFFAQTEAGDLLGFFRGHYDTTTGPKRDPESYRRITKLMHQEPGQVLFLSDVTPELDAAATAGLQTGLVVRPGNPPASEVQLHPVLTSFDQIHLA